MDKLQVVKATAKSHQNIDQKMLDSTWRPPLNGMGVGQWFLGKAQKKDWWFDLICGLVAVTVSEVQFIPITRPRFPLPSSFYMKSRPSNALDADKSSLLPLPERCTFIATVAFLHGSPMTIPWPNILTPHVHIHLPTTPASWRKKAEPRRRATSPHSHCTNHRLTNHDSQTGNFSGSEGWKFVDFYGWCVGVTGDVWKGKQWTPSVDAA